MSRNALCGFAAALATAGLAAPAAAAPVLQADQECYTPGESMTLTGTGYQPSSAIGLFFSLGGRHGRDILGLRDPITADSAGNVRVSVPAPDLASSDDTEEDVTATANPQTGGPPDPTTVGIAQFKLSTWDVLVTPWRQHRGEPGRRVRLHAYGWEPMTTLWAHYLHGGRTLADVRIGALTGPCGDLSRTIREFPFRPVPAGSYTIYFSGARRLDRRHDAWVRIPHVRVPASRAIR